MKARDPNACVHCGVSVVFRSKNCFDHTTRKAFEAREATPPSARKPAGEHLPQPRDQGLRWRAGESEARELFEKIAKAFNIEPALLAERRNDPLHKAARYTTLYAAERTLKPEDTILIGKKLGIESSGGRALARRTLKLIFQGRFPNRHVIIKIFADLAIEAPA